MPIEADLQAKRRDGPEYVANKLLSHPHDENGALYFETKWADYENSAWKPRDCMSERLVCRYYRRLRRRKARAASARAIHS